MVEALPLVGIGIDTISWNRAKRFLQEHPFSSVQRLLTPLEQNQFKKTPSPLNFFARSLAAKEAYFKALGGAWMGEAGFRAIEVKMEEDRFQVPGRYATEGTFSETEKGVIARIVVTRRQDDEQ